MDEKDLRTIIEQVHPLGVEPPLGAQEKKRPGQVNYNDHLSRQRTKGILIGLCQPSAPAAKRKNHPPQQQKGRKGQYAGEPCALSCRPHRPARQRPHRRGQQRGEQDHIELPRGNIIAVQRITT